MRAAVVHAYGSAPAIDDFDDPRGREQLVVADVLAAGLNPVDLRIATGTFHGLRPDVPYVVGREGVVRLPDGRRAYLEEPPLPYGTAAERTLAHPEQVIPIPDGVDDATAVALGIAGLAAWLPLEWRARVQPGERVLVLGATGVVGLVAVQGARLLGAGRVVAAGRSPEGLERARAAGADAVVRLDEDADLAAAFRDAAGGPLDVVIDPLWGAPAKAAMAACAPFARLVQIGQSAAPELDLASALVRGTPVDILGHTNGRAPVAVRRAAYERMVAAAAAGQLSVPVETVALADVARAWERQGSSPNVKLVLVP